MHIEIWGMLHFKIDKLLMVTLVSKLVRELRRLLLIGYSPNYICLANFMSCAVKIFYMKQNIIKVVKHF